MRTKKPPVKLFPVLLLCLLTFTQGQSLKELYENNKPPKLEMVWEFSETDEVLIQDPQNLKVDASGNIYFLDEKLSCIKKLSPEGKFLKQIGRSGKGPGEFLRIMTYNFGTDGNYSIYDSQNQRVSLFDKTDKYQRSQKINTNYDQLYSLGKNYVGRKTILADITKLPAAKFRLILLDSTLKEISELTGGDFKKTIINRSKTSINISNIYYAENSFAVTNSNNDFCYFNSENYNITIAGQDGKIKLNSTIKKNRIPVSARDIEKITKEHHEKYPDKNSPMRDMIKYNDHKPHFQYVIADGNYFLARSYDDENKGLFDLISPEGKLVKQLELPKEIFNKSAVIKDGFVYTVSTSEDELPVVRKYKIN